MRARTLLLALAFVLLTGQRCQPRDRFCTDISMTVIIGQPGVLIPDCINNGPLQFQNREVVSFPGLSPQLETNEVPQSSGFYGVLVTPTAVAVPATIAVQLHDVPDPNFPRVTEDYTIHVTIIRELCPTGHDVNCLDFKETASNATLPVTAPETLTFRITSNYSINNPILNTLTDVRFANTLPNGLQVAAPPNIQNTCGGSLAGPGGHTPVAGDTAFDLSNVSLAPAASCTLSIDVSSAQPGTFTNETSPLTWTAPAHFGGGLITGAQASATFTVTEAAPPSLVKSFAQPTIQVNAPVTLTFTITNEDPTVSATGVNFTDIFPSGLQVAATPNLTNDCGGTIVGASGTPPAAGDPMVSLSGVVLGPLASCSLSIQVSSAVPRSYLNTAAATSNEGGTGPASTAQLTVTPIGAVSLVSITVTPGTSTPATVVIGHAIPFTAIANYSDGTMAPLPSVNWTSSAPSSASVTNQGVALGVAAATGITITAQDPGTGIKGAATLNVRASGLYRIVVTPDPGQVAPGSSLSLTATGYTSDGTTVNMTTAVAWSSSVPSVVSVNSQGFATASSSTSGTRVDIIAADPVTGISGITTLTVPQVAVNVGAQPATTDGLSNLVCNASGAGPFTFGWHGYQDDGTNAGVLFSNASVQDPQVTVSTASGNGANFYVFCVATRTTDGVSGSGYGLVTLTTGETVPNVTVNPDSIRAAATDVTFDGTSSLNALSATQWVVQYGGNVVPSSLEGYLTLPPTAWTTVYSDDAPASLVETVPAAMFSSSGAYRVQLTVTSSLDFSVNEGTFYFQVGP